MHSFGSRCWHRQGSERTNLTGKRVGFSGRRSFSTRQVPLKQVLLMFPEPGGLNEELSMAHVKIWAEFLWEDLKVTPRRMEVSFFSRRKSTQKVISSLGTL